MGKRILTALFILLPITLFAQDKASQIVHIRQIVEAINTQSSLTKIILDTEKLAKAGSRSETDGGEELTGYYNNGELVKIVYSVGISTGMITVQYYLDNKKPVFIYQQQDMYVYDDKQQQFNYNKLANKFKGRYYYDDGLIKKNEQGTPVASVANNASHLKAQIPAYAALLLKAYRSQK